MDKIVPEYPITFVAFLPSLLLQDFCPSAVFVGVADATKFMMWQGDWAEMWLAKVTGGCKP